jgi:hypothetical protein
MKSQLSICWHVPGIWLQTRKKIMATIIQGSQDGKIKDISQIDVKS